MAGDSKPLLATEDFFRVRTGIGRRRARCPEYDSVRRVGGPTRTVGRGPRSVVQIRESIVEPGRRRAAVREIRGSAHSRSRSELRGTFRVPSGITADSCPVVGERSGSDERFQGFGFQYRHVGFQYVDFALQVIDAIDHFVPLSGRERRASRHFCRKAERGRINGVR